MIQGSGVLLSEGMKKKWLSSQERRLPLFDIKGGNTLNAICSPLLSKNISSHNQNLMHVRGANMSFWKENLVRANGFNEDFLDGGVRIRNLLHG